MGKLIDVLLSQESVIFSESRVFNKKRIERKLINITSCMFSGRTFLVNTRITFLFK